MMLPRPALPVLWLLSVCSLASALSGLQIENAKVGERTLVITVDDSIKAPDLSKIQIEGYGIESAVFIEEGDDDSLRLSPNLVDLTLPGRGRILDFIPDAGLLVMDAPADFQPQPGDILADTSFGGLLRKVVSLEGSPQSVTAGLRWSLRTVEAGLPDAVLDCDISFRTRLDLNLALPDMHKDEEVVGSLEDGTPANGEIEYGLAGSRVIFQPMVTGRLRISQGKMVSLNFRMQGDCEVSGKLRGALTGTGEFEYEDELRGRPPVMVPLGHGLFVKVQNRPFVRIEAQAHGDGFSAGVDFRVLNSLRGELGFEGGQWRPLAENRMISDGKQAEEISGSGEMKLILKPRIDILIEGTQGPTFTFEPYARFSSLEPQAADSDGAAIPASRPGVPGAIGTGSFRDFPFTPPDRSRKELSLGSNIYMDTRTNFAGPAMTRNFLLFNHEQLTLSPPKDGMLFVRETDSNRVFLNCETYPKADTYQIQQMTGAGPWVTVIEKTAGPRLRLGNLKPGTQYRFRAVGFNAMGMGKPFPPEGILYVTPAANHPPFIPVLRFPDSGSALADSSPVLAWHGGDPDPGGKVLYTVYLDTRYPPTAVRAAGLVESTLTVPGLQRGVTYYWKVTASDGLERSEGGIRAFTLKLPAAPEGVAAHPEGAYAAIPKGFLRREDGKSVAVGPLLMDRYEVTQADFEKVMGRNPSYHLQDSLPVERVTWEEAETYCRETGGRLPTEAEWEYAARAGNAEAFYWGKKNPGDYAWFRDNSDNRTQKVGQKKPNAWGLYDMAGNVFEWAQDWYGDYSKQDLDHPKGPPQGVVKVIRGASWYSESGNLNLSARYNNRPGFRNFKVGFRCARDGENLAEVLRPAAALAAKGTEPAVPSAPAPASVTPVAPSPNPGLP